MGYTLNMVVMAKTIYT